MLRRFQGKSPSVDGSAFVDASAQIIGDVVIGAEASIWFNAVLRGDVMPIRIGARSNVQDLSVVHVTSGRFGATIGEGVTVGHAVTIHGCTIGDGSLLGIGAIILDGAVVGESCLIGAGALVTPGTVIPPRSLVLGSPARVKRPLNDAELAMLLDSTAHYVELAKLYRSESR